MASLFRRFTRLGDRLGRRGVSCLEFAALAPILILVLVGASDFGNALQQATRLETAARAGAQFAIGTTVNVDAIRNAALAALPAGQGATAIVTCACATVAQGCGAPCASDLRLTVVVERDYTPMIFFGLPNRLRGNATIRLQ